MPKATGYQVHELELLEDITRSQGWKVVKNIINNHRIDLIERAHKALKKHEDRKAGELLACSEEPNKILLIIQARKEELSRIIEEGNKE